MNFPAKSVRKASTTAPAETMTQTAMRWSGEERHNTATARVAIDTSVMNLVKMHVFG